jgi:hypothetical protein
MTRRFYCTLFDKNYLYQGVALHRSLARHARDFTLYALCMDSIAYDLLQRMNVPSLTPIRVEELLSEQVAQVRRRTTHGQFCWVCQPLVCEYLLDRFGLDMVTYLEADSLFFSDPEALLQELGDRAVSLVPHNYSAEFDNSEAAGRFCVQFNAFRNDPTGRRVLGYWRQRCFEYDKSRLLRYPGQTCLDDWPVRFENVAIIGHRGAGVAPWNIRGYRIGGSESTPTVDGMPVVFYHYHQYARCKGGGHDLGSYPMTRQAIDTFYRPYVRELRLAESAVHAVEPEFRFRRESPNVSSLADLLRGFSGSSAVEYLRGLNRRLRGRYNVYADAYFSA